MALSVAKGVLTAPTAGGLPVSQAITGLGFQVKALLLFASYQTAAGQSNGPGRFSLGMATQDGGTVQQGYSTIFNPDNVATATMNVGTNTNAVLKGLTAPSATTVGAEYIATCASLDSDGFTLSWTDLPASAIKVHYLALGGTDISAAKVVSSTLASNTTTNVTVGTGWGQPDLLLAMGSSGGFSFGDFAAAGNMLLGAALSNTVRQSATIWSEDAAPAENLVGSQRQKFIYTFRGSTAGGAAEANADLSAKGSWPTDGFQVSNSGATSGDSIIFLALKGTFQASIGTMTGSSTLNSTTDYAAGFTPAGALLWGLNQPATAADITADGTGVQWGAFGVGAYDGTNQGFAAYSSDLANTTISTGQSHSETKVWQDIDPATTGAPTLNGEAQASVSGTNLRATQTDADIVATRVRNILVLGSAAGGTTPVSQTFSAPIDAAGSITSALAAPYDAVKALATTISVPLEAQQRTAAAWSSSYDAGQGISAPTGSPWDTIGPLTAALSSPWETTAPISAPLAAPWDAPQGLRSTVLGAWEAVAALAAAVAAPWDAPGRLQAAWAAPLDVLIRISSVVAAPWDTEAPPGVVVQTFAGQWESIAVLSPVTLAIPFEAPQGIIATRALPYDVLIGTRQALSAPWDTVARLIATNSLPYDTLAELAAAIAAAWDAQALAGTSWEVPWEAAGLSHPPVIFAPLPAGRIAGAQPGSATHRSGGFIAGHVPGPAGGGTPGELVGPSRGRVHTSGVKP